ncbi:uncharacterized protein BX664DRAFT_334333 [Halteromyces radiatus]|uniref:uncharacterized protein n=1 Tax=Halteromyces radiatus TaxID=101107 RepID=UPI00221F487F|nr:uncharacterized protein BX664DRAFT_334333 [Halteromyces radiatus]KAI8089968.1 hypothetical protein BX664DRAFT_334333 [Halteromyces radiatus]
MNDMDMDDMPSMEKPQEQPVKIRKKPGRKPNPASPALRKAQNRAAQRAFRERKERHMRELEVAIKQIREQRDKLFLENEQLRADAEINRSENWYLKGIVLTLQLVCYQHNLAIPQHGPFVNDQALSVMAQSTPGPIAAYLNVNANSKIPTPTQLSGYQHSIKQRDRYLSVGSIVVTKDDVCQQQFSSIHTSPPPPPQQQQQQQSQIGFTSHPLSPDSCQDINVHPSTSEKDEDEDITMPDLSPVEQPLMDSMSTASIPRGLQNEPITSNLAAIQTLRLRLRLQSACARMDSVPFSIQPSILQLTIPHDPRIDLIPTPHMRDRMILFREQFDLDDCFKCLLSGSVFHGGDPAIAANWQLPKVFFEKYWFLTIDYTLRRTTNRWRRLQGLNDLESDLEKQDTIDKKDNKQEDKTSSMNSMDTAALAGIPPLENQQSLNFTGLSSSIEPSFGLADLSSYLGVEFSKLEQIRQQEQRNSQDNNSQPSSLDIPTSPLQHPLSQLNEDDSFEPVRLTNGYLLPQKPKSPVVNPTMTHHPGSVSSTALQQDQQEPWDNLLNQPGYDLLVNSFLHTDPQS